jgi:hypothetical protein
VYPAGKACVRKVTLVSSGLPPGKPKLTPETRNMAFSYVHYVESTFVPASLINLDSLSKSCAPIVICYAVMIT